MLALKEGKTHPPSYNSFPKGFPGYIKEPPATDCFGNLGDVYPVKWQINERHDSIES